MEEQEVRELFFERLEHLSAEAEYGLRHRDTRYYAEPFEAPAWRAQWVERMEEPGSPAS